MELTPLENWIINKAEIKDRSREAIEWYQLKKLQETLSYVKSNSSFYKQHLKDINEGSIHTFDDFQRIPFTYSYQISQNPYSFLCVPQKAVKRIVTLNTSGTTGNEKRVFFTEEDLEHTIEFFKYGMSCLTDISDKVLILLPGNAYGSIGDLLKKALKSTTAERIVHGILTDPEEVIKCIEDNDITCIVGIPMQVLYLSRFNREAFRNKIKKVLLSTDYVPEVLINELTQKCGCKVFTHYGMTEMGYGGGVECKVLSGYHMREADIYFEIINPNTGEAVEGGEYGEVVFTTLTRKAMPLIRYRTGDIAAFSKTECECGTFLKTMQRSLGRIDNKVRLNEGQFLYLRKLDEIVLAFEEIIDFKAYIDTTNKLVIEVIMQNHEGFEVLENKLMLKIVEMLKKNYGYIYDIKIILNEGHKPIHIANSMVKRRIVDYRRIVQTITGEV